MKRIILIPIVSVLLSCDNSKSQKTVHSEVYEPETLKTNQANGTSVIDTVTKPIIEVKKTNISKTIIGLWIGKGDENVTFRVNSKTFYYLEDSAYYPYEIKKDSVTIKYDDGPETFAMVFRGKDTLILKSELGVDTFIRKLNN